MDHFLEAAKLDGSRSLTIVDARNAIMELQEQMKRDSRNRPIVGMKKAIGRLIIALIIRGHVLLEGNPGLVKTVLTRVLGHRLGLDFQRIQFMPDISPSDIAGHDVLAKSEEGKPEIEFRPGKLHCNMLLADEINRAAPKTLAGLLECMAENTVTLLNERSKLVRPRKPLSKFDEAKAISEGDVYFKYPSKPGDPTNPEDPWACDLQSFIVVGTQNPIEIESVFPLPEAALDRFLFQLEIHQPDNAGLEEIGDGHGFEPDRTRFSANGSNVAALERQHLKVLYFLAQLRHLLLGDSAKAAWEKNPARKLVHLFITLSHLRRAGTGDVGTSLGLAPSKADEQARALLTGYLDKGSPKEKSMADHLLNRSREDCFPEILSGISPRAMLMWIRAAHVHAFMRRCEVSAWTDDPAELAPDWKLDFCELAPDLFRHRIRLTAASLSEGQRPEDLIAELKVALEKLV